MRIEEGLWQNCKLVSFFLEIFKVVYFAPKNMHISKNAIKFNILFFQNDLPAYIYIYKCIDNFKFLKPQKSYE